MADEKVSVIVPVYNVEKYLRRCLDSIINQTYQNLEIILVDDGSPDNCGAICDEYAVKDQRVRVIHQENGGLSAARNAGLDCISGEYIVFVDSDDWISEIMIESLLERCLAENADLAICDVAVYDNEKGVKPHESPITDATLSQAELVQKMTENQAWHYIIACNKLYRRDIFLTLRFPNGFIHEDAAVAHRIAGECQTIVTVAKELYFYRQNPASITGSAFSISRTDNLSALSDRIQYAYHKKWSNMWNETASRYVYSFFDLYFRFENSRGNTVYFNRMEASLRTALPYLIQSNMVSIRHKLYLLLIRINPSIYYLLRKSKRGTHP